MKKTVLLSFFIVSILAVNAADQNNGLSQYGRWSIAADAGFSLFDGDLKPYYKPMGILMSPNFGVSLEYNVNPNFALGWNVGGMFFDQEDNDETFTSGGMYTSTYISTDLFSLLRGKKSKFFGLWASAGVGMGGTYLPEYTTTRNLKEEPPLKPNINGVIYAPSFFIFPFTLNFEFNLSEAYSLGIMGRYVYTNTDQIESVYRHEYVDQWETAGISLRYKFITNDKKHFRDEVFTRPDPSIVLITALQTEITHLHGKVDGRLDKLENRVEKLEGILSSDGPDTDKDGVPDVRDLEPTTPRGNTVDFWGRTIAVKIMDEQPVMSVYFDFDKTELSTTSQNVIIKVAEKMKANPSMMLEIRGYTDNPGTSNYNLELSQRRAEVVKAELVQVYGISSKRMVANGKGMISYPPTQNLRSRRCDFFFSE